MLKEKILEDIKLAMKNKDTFRRDVLRFLNSSLKQIEVDERRELSDDDIMKIIQKSIKQRNDSIASFKEASRDDLVQKETQELEILQEYLPKQMSDDELQKAIEDIISQVNATSVEDMGKVMGKASKDLLGKADNQRISKIVSSILKPD